MNSHFAVLVAAAVLLNLTHFIPAAPTIRPRLVRRLGDNGFRAAYSLIALACIVVMGWAFKRLPDVYLWTPSPALRHLAALIMLMALVLAVTGLMTRNPTAVGMEDRLGDTAAATGVIRITRHPFLWGVALWAAAHILANADLASLIFFGAFLLLALAGMPAIDHKRAVADPDNWREFAASTSIMPFAAIMRGRNRMAVSEIGVIKPLVSLLVYGLLLTGHRWLFGVAPLS